MSKIQCEMYFDGNWMLIDGDLDGGKSSTNGTWLYLNEDFEIYDRMVFKTHQTLMEVAVE